MLDELGVVAIGGRPLHSQGHALPIHEQLEPATEWDSVP